MDVSIVIINFNTFTLTCNCIQSIIEKTKDVSFEIILVDNASVEIDAEEFKTRFPEIVLIKNQTNEGFSKGCNVGIEHTKGEYILLLNSDTILVNNAVLICRDFLRKHPKVAVVSSRLEYEDGTIQSNCHRFPSVKYGLFELFRMQKIIPKKWGGKILFGYFFDCNSIAFPDWVWGTYFMFEKRKLRQLENNKLAEDFFMYVEDMQWCKDFRLRGYAIAIQPEARVIHLVGKSGASRSSMMMVNTEKFMAKYYPAWEIKWIKIINKLLTRKDA